MRSKRNNTTKVGSIFIVAFALFVGYFLGHGGFSFDGNDQGNVAGASSGFNQYGYNYGARIFNSKASDWCLSRGASADCLGAYSNDKLLMKWNAEWDRGNLESWSKPPYAAWEDNEWNGKIPGGTGENWHYKIVWVGSCGADYTLLANGGYCIWGQFNVIMDQGQDPNVGAGHTWFSHANPTGYGAYKQ